MNLQATEIVHFIYLWISFLKKLWFFALLNFLKPQNPPIFDYCVTVF